MSEIKVNKISPRAACGTTQLGDSGDTFTVPSGAAITIASGATINNNGTQITLELQVLLTGKQQLNQQILQQ